MTDQTEVPGLLVLLFGYDHQACSDPFSQYPLARSPCIHPVAGPVRTIEYYDTTECYYSDFQRSIIIIMFPLKRLPSQVRMYITTIASWERRRNRKSFGGRSGVGIVLSGFHSFHLRKGGCRARRERGN